MKASQIASDISLMLATCETLEEFQDKWHGYLKYLIDIGVVEGTVIEINKSEHTTRGKSE